MVGLPLLIPEMRMGAAGVADVGDRGCAQKEAAQVYFADFWGGKAIGVQGCFH